MTTPDDPTRSATPPEPQRSDAPEWSEVRRDDPAAVPTSAEVPPAPAPQYGQPTQYEHASQYGQPPAYGQVPQYGQPAAYGQAAQYGQPPQYGQAPTQYGQHTAYEQATVYPTQQPGQAYSYAYASPVAPDQQSYYAQPDAYQQSGYAAPAGAQQPYGQPGYPQQASYAPSSGGLDNGRPAAKSHAGVIVAIILVAVVLAAAAVVLFVKPGYLKSTVFDTNAVEQGVTTILTNAPTDNPAGYGLDGIAQVTCPPDVKVAAGDVFTCTLVQNGTTKTVDITIVDDGGTYRVGVPR